MADQIKGTTVQQSEELDTRLTRVEAVLGALSEALLGNSEEAQRILLGFISGRDCPVNWLRLLGANPNIPFKPDLNSEDYFRGKGVSIAHLPDLRELHNTANTAHKRQEWLDEKRSILEREHTALKTEMHEYLLVTSLGLEPSLVNLHRYLPVRLYLDTDDTDEIAHTSLALRRLVESEGYLTSEQFPPSRGPWFKEQWFKTRHKVTQPQIKLQMSNLGDKIQHGVEFLAVQGQPPDPIRTDSEAAKNLIEAMGETEGIVQIGTVLVVRVKSKNGDFKTSCRALSVKAMVYLEKHPELLMAPNKIFKVLSACDKPEETPSEYIL
ncbi:MAG TPA: hypothetical protein VGB45_08575 [Abditibacterium sp.]